MPTVTMEGIGETTCDEGRRLVLCIEDAGVDILHRCGGNARCTTCRVELVAGDAGEMTGSAWDGSTSCPRRLGSPARSNSGTI